MIPLKSQISNFTSVCMVMVPFYLGYLGAYKHIMIVVIKIGAFIYGMLILCGCLLSRSIVCRNHCFCVADIYQNYIPYHHTLNLGYLQPDSPDPDGIICSSNYLVIPFGITLGKVIGIEETLPLMDGKKAKLK